MSLPQFSKTKIVATVGPACDGPAQIEALVAAGVDVFRLNMAHGDRQRQSMRLAAIRTASRQLGHPVAVLADLAGPKPRLGDDDRENALWAAAGEIDFVGLSFVRRAEEVRELKDLLRGRQSTAQVIAKIEKPEALEHLREIVDVADGVVVARGDLRVETDIAEVAVLQKRVIAECNRRRKPVIVATQTLDSMRRASMPTGAEATDVTNAILDGADACMLSGETAIGEHPREAVVMMHRIALATEPLVCHDRRVPEAEPEAAAVDPITEATVHAAGHLAEELAAKLIVVASRSGATALALSKKRGFVPILGVSPSESALRRMCLYWGVIPLAGVSTAEPSRLVECVCAWGARNGLLGTGDLVVIVSGTGQGHTAHHQIAVHEVGG